MATVFTLGHSTRTIDALLALLRASGVTDLVDVRRFPGSRRYPHFAQPALAAALEAARVRYHHEVDLGGRRDAHPDSRNTAWRVAAFRGYADHMASAVFQAALARVIVLAARGRPAVMCAEAVPWRCHRQLIADALLVHGIEVVHILGAGQVRMHHRHPAAIVGADGTVVYPGPPAQRTLLD